MRNTTPTTPNLASNFQIPPTPPHLPHLASNRKTPKSDAIHHPNQKGKNPPNFRPKPRGFFQKKGGAWLGGKNIPTPPRVPPLRPTPTNRLRNSQINRLLSPRRIIEIGILSQSVSRSRSPQ